MFLREAYSLDRQKFKQTLVAMHLAQRDDPDEINKALRD